MSLDLASLMQHIESLPVPGVDNLPPAVLASRTEQEAARVVRQKVAALLHPKQDTEKQVKYVMERLLGGRFRKDGDWVTLPNGQEVFQKKLSDLVGELKIQQAPYNAVTYVEVKGVSPGNPFAFSRLDKRLNPKQPSQHEKLSAAAERGNIVLLAIGWWDNNRGAMPIKVDKHGKEGIKWNRADLDLTIDLIPWDDWLDVYENHKWRAIRQKDRYLFNYCRIYKKQNGRWDFCPYHWWEKFVVEGVI